MPGTRASLIALVGLPWTVLFSASCTFPSVDYEDPVLEPPPCAMPVQCEPTVTSCSKQAKVQGGPCFNKCDNGPTPDCMACQAAQDSALSACIAQCESCSASNGCANATDSCTAMLALP